MQKIHNAGKNKHLFIKMILHRLIFISLLICNKLPIISYIVAEVTKMNYDYNFGNDYYKYYQDEGLKITKYKILAPEQSQDVQPGMEYPMIPKPIFDNPKYKGSDKLKDKVAIITGGDSGLGRAAAIAFVKEGCNVVIPYYNEDVDASETKSYIESLGGSCLVIRGDITDIKFCKKIVE